LGISVDQPQLSIVTNSSKTPERDGKKKFRNLRTLLLLRLVWTTMAPASRRFFVIAAS
jgi:hypothetical protein